MKTVAKNIFAAPLKGLLEKFTLNVIGRSVALKGIETDIAATATIVSKSYGYNTRAAKLLHTFAQKRNLAGLISKYGSQEKIIGAF